MFTMTLIGAIRSRYLDSSSTSATNVYPLGYSDFESSTPLNAAEPNWHGPPHLFLPSPASGQDGMEVDSVEHVAHGLSLMEGYSKKFSKVSQMIVPLALSNYLC